METKIQDKPETETQANSQENIQETHENTQETQNNTQAPIKPAYVPPKKKKKLPKSVKVLVVLGVIGFGGYQFMSGKLDEVGKQYVAQAYVSGTAQLREVTVSVSSTGTVTPIDSFNVNALLTGDIVSAPFEEGEMVTQGQLLFQFDTSSAVNSIQQSQLSLERAQITYQQAVEATTPYATGAGIVQQIFVQNGESVSMGTPILEISQNADRTVKIPFHASQVTDLYVGQNATITLDNTMEQLTATIASISGVDEVGIGNVILRQVEFKLQNPGAITTETTATASVFGSSGQIFSAGNGSFSQNLTHTVTATSAGEISRLYVTQGQAVAYGQTVAQIGGSAVTSSVANAQNSVQSAQLSLANAQDSLSNYTVTAPISGTVIEKKFKAGDTLDSASLSAAGGNMAVIYDMTTLTFEMSIHELDINKIQLGQLVNITADAVEGAQYTGYVDKININGITAGGMTSYPITVVINDPEGLKPGMNVSAEVIVQSAGEVVAIPLEAVIRGEDGAYVQVGRPGSTNAEGIVVDTSLIERVPVELGVNDNNYIEVLSGLEDDTIVIWENQVVDPFASMMGPPV